MAISLYDVSVRSFLQTLGAVAHFLEKGRVHCEANGISLATLVETRVHEDMLPFRFQVISVCHHTAGALAGVKAGEFHPPGAMEPLDYAGLQALVADAKAALEALTPDEVNAYEGKDVVFKLGERAMPFTAEGFLQSFSTPNLHFHASMTYAILRATGVPLGKRDYMGALRMKTA